MHGISTDSFNRVGDVIEEAAQEFAKANHGRLPTEPSQITPYLQSSIDDARLRKYLEQIAAPAPQPAK